MEVEAVVSGSLVGSDGGLIKVVVIVWKSSMWRSKADMLWFGWAVGFSADEESGGLADGEVDEVKGVFVRFWIEKVASGGCGVFEAPGIAAKRMFASPDWALQLLESWSESPLQPWLLLATR